jgi:acyl-homoserine-lactone acylase
MLNLLFAFNYARTSADILRAIRQTQGVPWWTVIAADSDGEVLFSQIHSIPNVPDEQPERCSTELGQASFAASQFSVLDGSRTYCALQTDADAIVRVCR